MGKMMFCEWIWLLLQWKLYTRSALQATRSHYKRLRVGSAVDNWSTYLFLSRCVTPRATVDALSCRAHSSPHYNGSHLMCGSAGRGWILRSDWGATHLSISGRALWLHFFFRSTLNNFGSTVKQSRSTFWSMKDINFPIARWNLLP